MKGALIILLSVSMNITAAAQTRISQELLKTTDGEDVRLSDYLALRKPLVISFWATYCNPCLDEFEAVSGRFEQWKKEVDFEFIAVSIDDSRSAAKVRSMAAGKKWPFIVLIDINQDVKRSMNISEIPYYFIFDREGRLVNRHAGYLPGDELIMFRELKKLAGE